MLALWAAAFLTATGLTFGPERLPPIADAADPLVDAAEVVPGLLVQLAYSRPENIVGRALYPVGMPCLLRRSVADRLSVAARTLAREGLRLVAWDCTRTAEAQAALFRAHPHPGSVADPSRGSLHQRGVAVDLGLADAQGRPVELPTDFDAFGPSAAADAPLSPGPARAHRDALILAMRRAGFRVNPKEWWHFSRLWGWRWPIAHPENRQRHSSVSSATSGSTEGSPPNSAHASATVGRPPRRNSPCSAERARGLRQ